jgi:hypothetical protein
VVVAEERELHVELAEYEDLRATVADAFGYDKAARPALLAKEMLRWGNALAWLKRSGASVYWASESVAVAIGADVYSEQPTLVEAVETLAREEQAALEGGAPNEI